MKFIKNVWFKLRDKIIASYNKRPLKRPDSDHHWTTIYYGARGSCKTLHQSWETLNVLNYLTALYLKYPRLKKSIVFTNSKLHKKIETEYKELIYYWNEPEDFHFCPRKKCWRGKNKHTLHGAYLIFDDIANILPANNWNNTPAWMRKIFLEGRHFSIRVIANLQDPFSCDINFRRSIDMAYKFTKIFGNDDPDETKPEVKRIFGMYRRRKIDAETLWRYGDLPEQTIRLLMTQREEENKQLKEMGKEMDIIYDESWRGSYHLYNRTGKLFFGLFNIGSTEIYDTLQDVQEYEPRGFLHKELNCIDPRHNHTDPKAINYCGHKKIIHDLV